MTSKLSFMLGTPHDGAARAAPDPSVAIEDRMDGALGGTPDIAVEAPDQQSPRALRAPQWDCSACPHTGMHPPFASESLNALTRTATAASDQNLITVRRP